MTERYRVDTSSSTAGRRYAKRGRSRETLSIYLPKLGVVEAPNVLDPVNVSTMVEYGKSVAKQVCDGDPSCQR